MNKSLVYLLIGLIGSFGFVSCTKRVNDPSTKAQNNSEFVNFSLPGKQVIVTYPEMKAEITYKADSTLQWKTTTLDGEVAEGVDKMDYKQVGDSLVFVNWIESDGETVSQVIDFKKKKVFVYLSMQDNDARRQRSSLFFDGDLELVK